jgi:hypothetical protein
MPREVKKFLVLFCTMFTVLTMCAAVIALFVTEHVVLGAITAVIGFACLFAYVESDVGKYIARKFYEHH